jgi:acyl-CoA thioesterase-2
VPDPALPRTFLELMTLERVAADFFVGASPDYPWGRVYGGQVVAQALRAAAATVEQDHRVHSLHAYFVLGGRPRVPILYEVDRLREGRSFTTRRVVARQADGAILNLDASFQRVETDVDTQESALPEGIAMPDDLPETGWSGLGDVREIPTTPGVARSRMWMRIRDDLGDDPALHACGLAYLSDHNPMDAIVLSHPEGLNWEQLMTASLDHNVWFHRPVRADRWMLLDMSGHGLVNARGMSTGAVHDEHGVHVATVAQEGLVRSPRRPRPEG